MNPAAAVRGPKHVVTKGATPVLSPAEAMKLLETIDTGALAGLRDRALLSVMLYSFARVSAVLGMRRQDYFGQGSRGWLRLHEKGGRRHDVPAHHRASSTLDEHVEAAGLEEPKAALFQTRPGAGCRAGRSTRAPPPFTDRTSVVSPSWFVFPRRTVTSSTPSPSAASSTSAQRRALTSLRRIPAMKRSPAIAAARRPRSRATGSDSTPQPISRWRGRRQSRLRGQPVSLPPLRWAASVPGRRVVPMFGRCAAYANRAFAGYIARRGPTVAEAAGTTRGCRLPFGAPLGALGDRRRGKGQPRGRLGRTRAVGRSGDDQATCRGRWAPALDVLPHVPGDGDRLAVRHRNRSN